MSAPALSANHDAGQTVEQAVRSVHVIGAGPVGLLMTALLQDIDGLSVTLYEKRGEYTRTRMVQLSPYLLADSVESYRTDAIDTDSIEALFDLAELAAGIEFRQSIAPDLMALLRVWSLGFCPLKEIEQSLSQLIDGRSGNPVRRVPGVVAADDAIAMLEPGSAVVDCTGSRSLLRDALTPSADSADDEPDANTLNVRLEYALVITFLYGQPYDCNEYCKYYKNAGNRQYKFIPMVNRTHYDGSVSHVTGIVNITAREYEAMPARFDGAWLRANVPDAAASMDRFIDKVKEETHGEVVGDLEIVRIPLDLYRARNATNRNWLTSERSDSPLAHSPVFLAGDSAIGSPYFQSISLGFECAAFLAGLLAQQGLTLAEQLDRYELYMYKQWLRVYMRSKMIKHNKDVFESIDDPYALLEKLHIY
jgi:2-polyprenyl-6-methoxyphenol hydroxylase-like FAD-dependent oxidoreductase